MPLGRLCDFAFGRPILRWFRRWKFTLVIIVDGQPKPISLTHLWKHPDQFEPANRSIAWIRTILNQGRYGYPMPPAHLSVESEPQCLCLANDLLIHRRFAGISHQIGVATSIEKNVGFFARRNMYERTFAHGNHVCSYFASLEWFIGWHGRFINIVSSRRHTFTQTYHLRR